MPSSFPTLSPHRQHRYSLKEAWAANAPERLRSFLRSCEGSRRLDGVESLSDFSGRVNIRQPVLPESARLQRASSTQAYAGPGEHGSRVFQAVYPYAHHFGRGWHDSARPHSTMSFTDGAKKSAMNCRRRPGAEMQLRAPTAWRAACAPSKKLGADPGENLQAKRVGSW